MPYLICFVLYRRSEVGGEASTGCHESTGFHQHQGQRQSCVHREWNHLWKHW